MRVKYKDIANELGISTTAVSLALNNKPGVSEETRSKVFELYRSQMYAVNPQSAEVSMSRIEHEPILLVIHKKHGEIINDNPFFSDLIATIEQELMSQSFPLRILHFLPGQNLTEFRNTIKTISCSGIILVATEMDSTDLDYYKSINKPLVLLDSSFDFEHYDSVSINNKDAILQGMEYLYEMGHRNIGYLKSATPINNFEHRFDGFQKGLKHFAIEDNFHPVISLHCSMEQAYQEMKSYLNQAGSNLHLPTAFMSDLDYIAIGAIRALKEKSIRIPEDVSILGFDDIQACVMITPALSTIRVNRYDIGKLAVNRLLQLVDAPSNFYTNTHISTELVRRKSVLKLV